MTRRWVCLALLSVLTAVPASGHGPPHGRFLRSITEVADCTALSAGQLPPAGTDNLILCYDGDLYMVDDAGTATVIAAGAGGITDLVGAPMTTSDNFTLYAVSNVATAARLGTFLTNTNCEAVAAPGSGHILLCYDSTTGDLTIVDAAGGTVDEAQESEDDTPVAGEIAQWTTDTDGTLRLGGTTVNNDHGSTTGLTDDDHTQYAVSDISSSFLNPNGNVACASGEQGRKVYRSSDGGILWFARVCTGSASTSVWSPLNEQHVVQHFANTNAAAVGCFAWTGTTSVIACNSPNLRKHLRFDRSMLVTRVVLADENGGDNGTNCEVHLWKVPSGTSFVADPSTEPTDGYLLVSDTSTFDGTGTKLKDFKVWDAGMTVSEWVFAAGDSLEIELQPCDTPGGVSPYWSVSAVPLL